jgi:broad specificity phosphatase PhoE
VYLCAALAELTVARHGQSTSNAAFAKADAAGLAESGITGRDVDVPLSPLGRAQAAALGRGLAAEPPVVPPPEVVVCSPFLRARETWTIAAAAAAGSGLTLPEPVLDSRLGDRAMGELELLTTRAIADRFPAEAQRRREAGEFSYRPPGGESFGDVAARLDALLKDLDGRFPGRRVFLVAHDAVVLMLRQLIEGLTFDDLAEITARAPVGNATVTRFVNNGGQLTLAGYNMSAHLVPPQPR